MILTCMILSGCGGGATPKGQVVAVVNGQEVTFQDLSAQARMDGANQPNSKVLLQKVIGRMLLAQEAHQKGLDRYPGFPSDMTALKQNFLAQKEVRASVKPTPTPSGSQIAAFMSAHPALFARRAKVQLTEITIHDGIDRKSLQGPESMDQLERKLTSLNVAFDRRQQQVDTAEIPAALAARVLDSADGTLTFIDGPRETLAFTVTGRTPVSLPPDAEQALAVRLIQQQAGQQQVNTLLQAQESRAHIAYQKGFAPDVTGQKPNAGPAQAVGGAT